MSNYSTRIAAAKAEFDDTAALNSTDIAWLIRIADKSDSLRRNTRAEADQADYGLVDDGGIATSVRVNAASALNTELDSTK